MAAKEFNPLSSRSSNPDSGESDFSKVMQLPEVFSGHFVDKTKHLKKWCHINYRILYAYQKVSEYGHFRWSGGNKHIPGEVREHISKLVFYLSLCHFEPMLVENFVNKTSCCFQQQRQLRQQLTHVHYPGTL